MKQGEKSQVKARAAADPAGSRLAVVTRQIDKLTFDPTNPRVHTPRQVGQIARSIEAFGFNIPVLSDRLWQAARSD